MGGRGEELAAEFLRRRGYHLLARNYRTPWGEVDLIARHRGWLVFIEVKARRSDRFGLPQEAVHPAKQEKLRAAAEHYLQAQGLTETPVRFDVVAIRLTATGPLIELIEDAF
ncbi:MAG: YraN family protein [Syntrophobacterales bacterium]|nr:YraN family protein [Syntrophobacterales bacterium]